jgi:hypothetical protein
MSDVPAEIGTEHLLNTRLEFTSRSACSVRSLLVNIVIFTLNNVNCSRLLQIKYIKFLVSQSELIV